MKEKKPFGSRVSNTSQGIDTELSSLLLDQYHWFHQHPEISLCEYETTRKLKQLLTQFGVEILETDLTTGLVAVVRGAHPGKTIALRADMQTGRPADRPGGVDSGGAVIPAERPGSFGLLEPAVVHHVGAANSKCLDVVD